MKTNLLISLFVFFIWVSAQGQTAAKPVTKVPPPKPTPNTAQGKKAIPQVTAPGGDSYSPPTYVSPSKLGGGHDLYDVPEVTVVANKKFYLKDEITLQLTYLATDPFDKYLALGGTYTHAFDTFWGWEILNGNYAFAFGSGLKNDLTGNFGVNPSLIDYVQGYGTSNITVSPIYTKNLAFNSKTVYSQFAAVFGGGMAFFVYGGFQPIFDFGIILRYFIGPNSSLKIDFRDYVSPNGYTNNNLALTVGYAFDLHSK